MFSSTARHNLRRSVISQLSRRNYAVAATCRTPYDTSASHFAGASTAEKVNTQASYESKIISVMETLQPQPVTPEFKKSAAEDLKRAYKKQKFGDPALVEKLDFETMIPEGVHEPTEEEADMMLGKGYVDQLRQFFKYKPKLSGAATDSMMSLNSDFYTEQICMRAMAVLQYASLHKNDLNKGK